MIVVFLGPPGSGKGTQAKKFMAEKGLPQLSTGDMLRSAIREGTLLGKKAKSFMDQGALVPDEVVIDMIAERVQLSDCIHGFILDGFPRTIPQAEALDRMLSEKGRQIGRIVLFEIEEGLLVDRLSGRRTCSNCGAMYHVKTSPTKKPGSCDQCGSNQVVQRDDDREEVIRKRLQVYKNQTSPLASFYDGQGKLRRIDASESPESVHDALSSALK